MTRLESTQLVVKTQRGNEVKCTFVRGLHYILFKTSMIPIRKRAFAPLSICNNQEYENKKKAGRKEQVGYRKVKTSGVTFQKGVHDSQKAGV